MKYFLLALLVINLTVIFYQDVKDREVNWVLFPTALVLCGVYSLFVISYPELLLNWALNVLILFSLLVCLVLYIFVRFGRANTNLLTYLGLGDVLFFCVLSICFSPFNFILFVIASLLFSLIISLLMPLKKKTVPLAGLQSFSLILFLFFQIIFDSNPFNENWIFLWI
ncbi:MAG: hypothetical protein COC06_09555 [Bacteroidales bacterium]|nr:MAG: hypothetical protein COC06_09555 [Bacteroidales bacterium]